MEGQETFTAEELEAKTQEALNKYKSDQEHWVQKLVAEKKLAEQVLDAVGQVAENAETKWWRNPSINSREWEFKIKDK